MKKAAWLLTAVMTLFAARVCAYGDSEKAAEDTRTFVHISARDIVNKTDSPRANFSAVIDRLNHELVACGLFRVLNEADWARALAYQEKSAAAADDGGVQSRIKTPARLIKMTITQYGFSDEVSTDPVYGTTSRDNVAKVELILTVVDGITGQSMKSVNISRTAIARVANAPGQQRGGNYRENALQEACRMVCKDIVANLVALEPFYVMGSENGVVTMDVPSSVAKVGMFFEIRRQGKALLNRRTGRRDFQRIPLCVVQVVAVYSDYCDGRIVQIYSQEPVKEGYSVHAVPQPQPVPVTPGSSQAVPF